MKEYKLVRLNKQGKEIHDRIFKPVVDKDWKKIKAAVYWETEGDETVNDKYNLYIDGKFSKVITTKEVLKEEMKENLDEGHHERYSDILSFDEFISEKYQAE